MATKAYACDSCDRVHRFEDDAAMCCVPEPIEVWLCGVCEESHDTELEAEQCCAFAAAQCPTCRRDYGGHEPDAYAIRVAGHCRSCNPFYSYDEQDQIEKLCMEHTGEPARLNA